MDHISIVIVHYNTDQETKHCLASLRKMHIGEFKVSIFLVDNASKIPYKLSQEQAESVHLIRSEANLGFSGGNNIAIRAAIAQHNSDYVVLLNSDTLVEPDFLIKLHACAKANPQFGMITPMIHFAKGCEFHADSYSPAEKGKVIWYAGGTIDWLNLLSFHRGIDEVNRGQFDHQTTSDFATGCCVLISRDVLESVGLLSEDYFLYLEDTEWSMRTRLAGFEIGFCPQALIWHKNAGSTGGAGSIIHQYYQTRNRLLFFFKYGSWRTKLTVARFLVRLFMTGNAPERRAVLDLLSGKLGKQPILAS